MTAGATLLRWKIGREMVSQILGIFVGFGYCSGCDSVFFSAFLVVFSVILVLF